LVVHAGSVAARVVLMKLPRSGAMQPGTLAVNEPAPMSDVVMAMCMFGRTGNEVRMLMKTGKLIATFCWTVVMDDESSTMNKMSMLLFRFCSKKLCEVPVGAGTGVWIFLSLHAQSATRPNAVKVKRMRRAVMSVTSVWKNPSVT